MTSTVLKDRTKQFALNVIFCLRTIKSDEETRVIKTQLIRSVTSVAANYRAACRARSVREFYSKMCIVVEEIDETELWLDILTSIQANPKTELVALSSEANELISIFVKAKKTTAEKLTSKPPNS